MPTVRVVDTTPLPRERVLEAARDFSERRAELWPDVHVEHLELHDAGETLAEVTEGNPWPIGFVWERLRYDRSEPSAGAGFYGPHTGGGSDAGGRAIGQRVGGEVIAARG